jgi:aldose 1-epimerase
MNQMDPFPKYPKLSIKPFGLLSDGSKIELYTLRNSKGMELSITNFGATVQSIKVPTKGGILLDVALGFDKIQDYESAFAIGSSPYFGAIIGRVAGRIHRGKFTLNGKTYTLDCNLGNDHLHGGKGGFSAAVWTLVSSSNQENPSITFQLFSKGIDCGYPGDVTAEVRYTLHEDNRISIEMNATSTEDTVLNLTQHTYFNLNGHSETLDAQILQINAEHILEVDERLIPTGNLVPLVNHPFDFIRPKVCPEAIDNSFILNKDSLQQATMYNELNGLGLSVQTNQDILHVYIGGETDIYGKNAKKYHQRSGICFETQGYPDAPNQPNFPSIALRKGEQYHSETIFTFQACYSLPLNHTSFYFP